MVNKRDSTFEDEDSPHYQKKYFQELHDHAAAEGQKMGTEMAAYFEQEKLGESLGKIEVHNHPDKNGFQREWRSQEVQHMNICIYTHTNMYLHIAFLDSVPPCVLFFLLWYFPFPPLFPFLPVCFVQCFVRLGECEFLKEGLTFEAEYIYIHVLRMVAMAINPDYQVLTSLNLASSPQLVLLFQLTVNMVHFLNF
jgi:hypothetical protein